MDRSEEAYRRQLERSRKWKSEHKERHAELAKAYRERNPEKFKAQQAAAYARRKGILVRGNCEKCGTDSNVHGHHEDYSKPLEVRWLCYLCHKAEHPVDDEDKRSKFSGAARSRLVGESNPNASLDAPTVRLIRRAIKAGISQMKIAVSFGTNQGTVSRIALRKSYTDVD